MSTGQTAKTPNTDQAAVPWAAALNKLREWDPPLGGAGCKDDGESLDGGSFANQVHRVG